MKSFNRIENVIWTAMALFVTIAYVSTAFHRSATIKAVNNAATIETVRDIDYPERAK